MGRAPDADSDQSDSTVSGESGNQHVDRLLNALATYRRRCVLYQLLDDTPTTLDELVDGVAAMETGRLAQEIPSDSRATLQAELYHQTLPKLTELGIVEFDPQTKTVSYQQPPPHIEAFLALTRELDPVSAE